MNEALEALAQRNVDHYDEHPVIHMAVATGILVAGAVAFKAMLHKATEAEIQNKKNVFERIHNKRS